ncbi:MAG TPA: DNA-3-methyladenine glycosylase 2 family protein [Actinomycetota bacterium]|nr:DNA-3-methyladenine glycosylase 2 family protein [Actinomycetota bacterium]
MTTFELVPRGPFSLEESAMFGFGQRHQDGYDSMMRLAFCVDGFAGQAAVALTQPGGLDGVVHGEIYARVGDAPTETIVAQVARVLSLDHDATGFLAVGDRDPVIADLHAAAPGLRPPLFYSPYEAAVWAVISSRRPHGVAELWRRRLSTSGGPPLAVAGQTMWALPTPASIAVMGPRRVAEATGIELVRAKRVVDVAEAAWAGALDADRLRAMDPAAARTQLRAIPGIGPFYADLILIRATGATDLFPAAEPKLLALLGDLYGLGRPATPEEATAAAEVWSPWRTWAAVLVRAAGRRVLAAA